MNEIELTNVLVTFKDFINNHYQKEIIKSVGIKIVNDFPDLHAYNEKLDPFKHVMKPILKIYINGTPFTECTIVKEFPTKEETYQFLIDNMHTYIMMEGLKKIFTEYNNVITLQPN